MKVKLRLTNQIPGMGGLNRIALLEDGWQPGMIMDAEQLSCDRLLVKWGNEPHQSRTVFRHEIEVI
jgi:hypothetical protein